MIFYYLTTDRLSGHTVFKMAANEIRKYHTTKKVPVRIESGN